MDSFIPIPESLAAELDQAAEREHKQRNDYAVDVLSQHLRRRRQLIALDLSSGCWDPANHPELADGAAAYVEKIRSEVDQRFENALLRSQDQS